MNEMNVIELEYNNSLICKCISFIREPVSGRRPPSCATRHPSQPVALRGKRLSRTWGI